ncbi:glutaredoxin 3 [Gammaproteobacteria bacterium ESL0073]|uniref:Glutaredoxin n=1 Tax=Entomomonas moraniae TaxID=2213226 RepID=A0A451EP98_9GAMM|nr:glutaredoxin 3 [Entomomonas moraniae]AWM81546.1 glutaredoxin 3 [Gammaproteobacteria bacterium ESL0073]AZS51619.1 glutaredoxin 3 [Entomomonas moraniae]
MANIIIYTSAWCPYCIRAKQLLTQKGVTFQEISVDGKSDVRAEMSQKANSNSVPQIWINDFHVGGCDDLVALENEGKLDKLLATH